jgi:hypothetical protein
VVQEENAISLELTAFRDAILHNTPVAVNELDGYMALDVAHQILQKLEHSAQGGHSTPA